MVTLKPNLGANLNANWKKWSGLRNLQENLENHSNFSNLKIVNSFIYDEHDPSTDIGRFSIIANVGLISLIGLCSMSYVPQFSFLNSPKLFYITGMTGFVLPTIRFLL